MTKFLRLSAAAGLLAVAAAAIAPSLAAREGQGRMEFGPGRGPGGPGGPMADIGRQLRGLDLTDDQRQQVRTIVQSHEAEMKGLGERLRPAREALDEAVTASPLDESVVRARSAEVAVVEADAAVLRGRVHGEVYSVLTTEQQAKAAALKATMKVRMAEREAHRRERPKGR